MHMQGDEMVVNDSDDAPPASIPGSGGRMIGPDNLESNFEAT